MVPFGNKVDVKDRKVKARQIVFSRKHGIQYYDVSAKSNYQFEKPFLWLLKRLTNDSGLTLIEAPSLQPQDITIGNEQIKQMEEELRQAENAPINDDDEDI